MAQSLSTFCFSLLRDEGLAESNLPSSNPHSQSTFSRTQIPYNAKPPHSVGSIPFSLSLYLPAYIPLPSSRPPGPSCLLSRISRFAQFHWARLSRLYTAPFLAL